MNASDLARHIHQHALDVPLLDRLRGESFIPGVPYVAQAAAWMVEAADEIERLQTEMDGLYSVLDEMPVDLDDLFGDGA